MEKRRLLSLVLAACLIVMNVAGCADLNFGNAATEPTEGTTTEPTATEPTVTEPTVTEPTATDPEVTMPDAATFPTVDPNEILDYFTYTVTDGKATITAVDPAISGNIAIPATLGGYPVTAIEGSAFEGCRELTGLVIPEGVTNIGGYICFYLPKLTDVFIPSTVTIIGERVFEACNNLVGMWVDENNPVYSSDAYGVLFNKEKTHLLAAPGALKTYSVPEGVERIDDYSFDYRENLTSITIPDSVTSIGWAAFNGCKSLTSVTIPGSVTNIDVCAFGACMNLTTVVIHEGVTTLSEYIFGDCINLTSVAIPKSVTSIEKEAFFECSKLQTVYYSGSERDWMTMKIGTDNDYLIGATVVYNYTVPANG